VVVVVVFLSPVLDGRVAGVALIRQPIFFIEPTAEIH